MTSIASGCLFLAPKPDAAITTLSGGNQQKVLLARALALEPGVLLLNDPTRGVDVATRHVLYDVFRELAREGMTLVILSSEIEEILLLCHRVLVFRENEVAAEMKGEAMTTDNVIAAMFGAGGISMSASSKIVSALRSGGFALVLLIVLLVFNLFLNPARFAPAAWGTLIGLAAPLIGAALASAPVILAGRGGIDISVGPMMGFVNAIVIQTLFLSSGIASPFILIPAALLIGAAIGAINGFMATVIRIQPIVATLGTYLVLTGVTLVILPAPVGPAPDWLKTLSGTYSIVPLLVIAVAWWAIRRLPYYDLLMAIGSDDRAAYTAGVDVTRVRFIAYVITGIFAGIAGLMLTALIGSADPNIGQTYTLIAVAAVALGGVSLAGGSRRADGVRRSARSISSCCRAC